MTTIARLERRLRPARPRRRSIIITSLRRDAVETSSKNSWHSTKRGSDEPRRPRHHDEDLFDSKHRAWLLQMLAMQHQPPAPPQAGQQPGRQQQGQ